MKLTLVEKRDEAKGTKSFFWKTEKPVNYLPGQYFYFTLPELKYPDSRGATRHFTLSSSPTEGNILRNTTRIRQESGYKKTLDELAVGTQIEGEGSNGTFTFDENEEAIHIFLAGGIGITPFRSMIKYAVDKNLQVPIHLVYSNSNEDEVTFGKELIDWDKNHESFKMDQVITSKVGRIDELKIQKFISHWSLVIGHLTWWVCGPPAMVDAMEHVLGQLKISSGRVRSEKFTGY